MHRSCRRRGSGRWRLAHRHLAARARLAAADRSGTGGVIGSITRSGGGDGSDHLRAPRRHEGSRIQPPRSAHPAKRRGDERRRQSALPRLPWILHRRRGCPRRGRRLPWMLSRGRLEFWRVAPLRSRGDQQQPHPDTERPRDCGDREVDPDAVSYDRAEEQAKEQETSEQGGDQETHDHADDHTRSAFTVHSSTGRPASLRVYEDGIDQMVLPAARGLRQLQRPRRGDVRLDLDGRPGRG